MSCVRYEDGYPVHECLCSEAFQYLDWHTEDEPNSETREDFSIKHGPSVKEDPRFAVFFKSNDVPMVAQAADINGIIEEHNASLKLVEAKLAEHHSKLYKIRAEMRSLTFKQSALIATQRHLDREIRRCRGIVNPVRRLPREIIAEIFLHLAPALTTGHSFRTTSWRNESRVPRVAIPWQLGRVCREWRTVAVSLHSLWNVCDFPSPPVTSSPEFGWSWMDDSEKVPTAEQTARIERSLASVEARLCRSGPSPISAQVVYQDNAHTLPLVDTLCRHSHRLKGLLLVDLPQKLIGLLSNSIAQNSQLRSLGLASTSTSRGDSFSFVYPSSLTNLHLSSLELSAATCSCIPWTQLTKYCEIKCNWRYADRWSSYSKLRNVVDLCVSFAEYCHKPQQPVLLPALRHARLTYFGAGSILQHFDTPILESLSYDHPKNADFELELPRRLPCLRSLRVRAENCPEFVCNLRHTMMMAPNLSEFFVAAKLPRAFDFVAALEEERAEDGSPPMQKSLSPLALNLEVLRLQIDTDGPYCAQQPDELYIDKLLEKMHVHLSSTNTNHAIPTLVLYECKVGFRYKDPDRETRLRAVAQWNAQGLDIYTRDSGQANVDFEGGHFCNEM